MTIRVVHDSWITSFAILLNSLFVSAVHYFPCGGHLIMSGKSMILILNSNPISLSCYENWLFNMVSELGLTGGFGFEPLLCKLNIWSPFLYLKVHKDYVLFVCLSTSEYGAARGGGC